MTKEQAIREHRKMWLWIARETLKRKYVVTKNDYLFRNSDKGWMGVFPSKGRAVDIKNDCFCCEYAYEIKADAIERYGYSSFKGSMCQNCPIDWGNEEASFMCEEYGSLYNQLRYIDDKNYKEAALIAYKISKLPESKGE